MKSGNSRTKTETVREKKREKDRRFGKRNYDIFMVFFTLKNTRLLANLRLIFARFEYIIGGGLGTETNGSNHIVFSLIIYFGEIYQTLCLMIIANYHQISEA